MTAPSLIERLEGAGVGSRELDGLIYGVEKELVRTQGTTFILDINGSEHFQFRHPTKMHPNGPAALYVSGYNVPEYTDSLDAALALAERVLDGDISYDLFHDFGGFNRAKVYAITDGPVLGEAKAETMPLALCAAILKARKDTL